MEHMTKEKLKEYRSKKEEISELQYKISHLDDDGRMLANDTILDYKKGFPRPQTVIGYDYERHKRNMDMYKKKEWRLRQECEEIEDWIESIQDSMTRRIFRMVYMEGFTQEKAAKKLHQDRSNISKKIDGYLKVSHNSQNSHI